jgi:hypothetical protein
MSSRIPKQHRGKRPRFFQAHGMDEMMSMVLELTSEIWVLKKRLYLLEKVADDAGISLTAGIEGYDLSAAEIAELDSLRSDFIAAVLRSTESDFSETRKVRDGGADRHNDADAEAKSAAA